MALLSATDIKKRQERSRQAQDRKIAKHKAKIADPQWRKEQNEKRIAAAKRQLEKKIAKRKEEKAANEHESDINVANILKKTPTARRRSTSKGLLGRTPNAAERRIMALICQLPCECCARAGRFNPVISYHHTDGRTKPMAHAKGLPLCQWHHDTPASKEELAKYPDLIPIHAKGSLGGKAEWEKLFGSQDSMLVDIWRKIGLTQAEIDLFELPNQ